jgi:anti-anti-sigma factor
MFQRVTQGAVDIIRGDSPLNADQAKEVAELLLECMGNGQPYVVFDLENVQLIDSAGLELLLDFSEQFQELGGALKLAAPNPLCREILSITGLSSSVEIFREPLAAAGSFAR